jgi:hypothetical protein
MTANGSTPRPAAPASARPTAAKAATAPPAIDFGDNNVAQSYDPATGILTIQVNVKADPIKPSQSGKTWIMAQGDGSAVYDGSRISLTVSRKPQTPAERQALAKSHQEWFGDS